MIGYVIPRRHDVGGATLQRHGWRFSVALKICLNPPGLRGRAPGRAGARNKRHPVNGANGEASEQIKCASRSAMRERRSGFDIANCGKRGVRAHNAPCRLRRVAAQKMILTAVGRPERRSAVCNYSFSKTRMYSTFLILVAGSKRSTDAEVSSLSPARFAA